MGSMIMVGLFIGIVILFQKSKKHSSYHNASKHNIYSHTASPSGSMPDKLQIAMKRARRHPDENFMNINPATGLPMVGIVDTAGNLKYDDDSFTKL